MAARDLRGRSVIVTGASAGIGWHTALTFARAGCRVAVVARREERLRHLAADIQRRGGTALVLAADLTDPAQCSAVVEGTVAAFGGVDVLVNNAGAGRTGLVDELAVEDYRELVEINYISAVAMTKAVLPHMRRARHGQIINISSVIGSRAMPLSSAYCAAKFALNGFTEALRSEVAGDSIAVTLIQPGLTLTEFGEVASRGTRYAGRPLRRRRLAQSPAHVAGVIVSCARRPRRQVTLTLTGRSFLALDLFSPPLVDVVMRLYARGAVRSLPRA